MTGLIKQSFSLTGHRTSVALEPEFWAVLEHLAQTRGVVLSKLVTEVDEARGAERPLASALRIFALEHK